MIASGSLSLREKAAQLLFPRLGSNMPPPTTPSEDADRFSELLSACPVGGLIVFNGRYPETRDVLSELQRTSRIPLLVGADMERGVGQQIRGATVFPHAMAYSALGEDAERLLEASSRVQAREAIACGIHVTFSPVADVNRDPRNPIIATRAFSSDPEASARLVRAFIRGCRTEGLMTAAKHFPGHGNTSRDSHAELPVVPSSLDDLEAFDLAPFRAAVEEEVDLVMSAHVLYPALDADRPATLSPRILRDLLRGRMGFEGAVVTDSLLMGAIRDTHKNAGRQAAALLRAGVDILLDVPDPLAAAAGIAKAVESGRLDERLLDEAVGRVLTLKRRMADRFGEDLFKVPESVVAAGEVGSDAAARIASEVAERAVTVVEDRAGWLPIDPADAADGGVAVFLVKPHRTRFDPPEEPFGRYVRAALPGAAFHQLGTEAKAQELDALQEMIETARLVILALVVKPAAWHAFGLLPEQERFVRSVLERRPAVVTSLGSPYVLDRYEAAAARLCAFSDVEASQRALVDRLVGTPGK